MRVEYVGGAVSGKSPGTKFMGQGSCGFPSPAAEYESPDLSLDDLAGIGLTTGRFLFRASGSSMTGVGIYDNDILVVDKSATPKIGDVVVAVVNSDFVVKCLAEGADGRPYLEAKSQTHRSIHLGDFEELSVWGVCTWVLHALR